MLATLIDFPDPNDAGAARLRQQFGTPLRVHEARALADVPKVLQAVERAARSGRWCVGGLAYEAARAFDAAFATHTPSHDLPLAWFAEYDAPLADGESATDAEPDALAHVHWLPGAHGEASRDAFEHAIDRIHQAIAAGECYQINYTAPLHGELFGSPRALFDALRAAQPGGYVACMPWGGEQVLSLSPELFFDWDGEASLLTRPMKGTAARGATPEADQALAEHLRTSPKERAENVMIVDLLRNDVSRIAMPHSVKVPRLFHVEALPTVWQMTSDVTAQTREGTRLVDVFAALFPCGSITGAPKVQAMRLINELEPEPRGVYCGALGIVRPGDAPGSLRATFNVPIRTLTLKADGAVRCGIGSGITASAGASDEWQEWKHKRAFIDRALPPLQVLETLALQQGEFQHLALHLARMRASAAHFHLDWPEQRIAQALNELLASHAQGDWRVRLLLGKEGAFEAQAFAFSATPQPVKLAIANRPFAAAHSDFVRHKTTRRSHYAAFEPMPDSGLFDVILWNEAGEFTECTRGNIAMQLHDGNWVTPPLSSGLLPGVGRALAIQSGRVREQVVHVSNARQVRAWAFINSLRGWLDAQLVGTVE